MCRIRPAEFLEPRFAPSLRACASLGVLAVFLLSGALVGCEAPRGEGIAETVVDSAAVVTYAFTLPVGAAAVAPSSSLVADLARDPHLGRLSISDESQGGEAARELNAEFVFGTVEAFLAWRDQVRIAALLDSVAALAPDTVTFTPELSVRRPSLYRTIVGRVAGGDGRAGRSVESVTCNDDCSRIDIAYRTRGNEAGTAGQGGGTGDAGDIDAVTLVCQPGLAGTIETCKASN